MQSPEFNIPEWLAQTTLWRPSQSNMDCYEVGRNSAGVLPGWGDKFSARLVLSQAAFLDVSWTSPLFLQAPCFPEQASCT